MRLPARIRRPRLAVLAVAVAIGVAVLAVPAAAQDVQPAGWDAELTVDRDDVNVRSADGALRLDHTRGRSATAASTESGRPQGMLLADRHGLDTPADRIAVELDADVPAGSSVLVDVRGERADGTWTEWVETRPAAPAVLSEPVLAVQSRVTLTSPAGSPGPAVRAVRLTAEAAGPPVARDADPARAVTYRLFATREGLVGGTTANGHVIRPRDHFVALPSRRGLAPRGTGDYTVRVCADNGRCEWAPVWDVGPWNTTDDNWSPPDVRESWRDLPQGMPQAQAAYEDGYNGGLDQYGRRVANPAGIDLADGTFWDGLQLRDNSWVTVDYLWAATGRVATVRAGLLNVRGGPTAAAPGVGFAAEHAKLFVECAVAGPPVTGSQGTTDQWLRIGPDQWVSAAYVATAPGAPSC